MPYYITAFDASGSQVLGNLDGQACLRFRRPERTHAWQLLGKTIRASARVKYWQLETADGCVLLTKQNPFFKEPTNANA